MIKETERIECTCNARYIKENIFALKIYYFACLLMFFEILFCMRDVFNLYSLLTFCGISVILLVPAVIMHIYYSSGYCNVSLILTDDCLRVLNARGKSKSYRLEELRKVKRVSKNRYRYGYCFYFADEKMTIYDGDHLSDLLIRLQKLGKYERET